MNEIIKKYASLVTKEQIVSFSLKENVKLTENEINIIYNAIKNDIDILLSKNSENYIKSYNGKISDSAYNCLLKLFSKYQKYIN